MPDASGAEVVETHSAVLFFVDDRVYKAKKHLDLGFLDFRTVASRRIACEREVELNSRLAPDVYDGVAELRGPDGSVWEHLVVMRRLPEERRLSACLDDDVLAAQQLHQVAAQVARLHATSPPPGALARFGTRDAVRAIWLDGVEVMAPHAGTVFDAQRQERIVSLLERYLEHREPLFDERLRDGWFRDGHGDLQAQDVFCLDDGPRVLDCLEFDDSLRWSDVLADVAFLAMDLERLGHVDVANRFLEDYRAASGAAWPVSLEHHYVAMRAHIRAKVAVLRAVQTGRADESIEQLQLLTLSHLEAAQPRLVLVGGPPGTGKSTLAAALGTLGDAEVLRSDELRQGTDPSTRYEQQAVERVYDTMASQARELLERGRHVVLDATFAVAQHRATMRRIGHDAAAQLVELRCSLEPAVARERVGRRLDAGDDVSEATPEVASRLAAEFEPWPEAHRIDTTAEPERCATDAAQHCGW